jgi:hypothetical protein
MSPRVALLAVLLTVPGFAQRPAPQLTFRGSGDDSINAAAVDSAGNIYVVGTTFSFDLPVRNAFQGANSGAQLIVSTGAGTVWKPLWTPLPSLTPLQPLSMAVDPTNGQVVYVAAGNSVCKSTDGGSQFQCVAIAFASSQTTVSSLAIDPQQPLTIYASASANGGVFKSSDGGQTWANASQGLPSQGFIDSVTVDPFHHNVLWAWAGTGGYVSTNGAGSWSLSAMPWPQNTSVSGYSVRFFFDPVTPGILYGPGFLTNYLGTQKSSDGGATWTPLNTPFSGCCAIVPDPRVSGLLYALAQPAAGGALQFWKSGDGGATWTSYPFPGGQFAILAVDPANPLTSWPVRFRASMAARPGVPTTPPARFSRGLRPLPPALSTRPLRLPGTHSSLSSCRTRKLWSSGLTSAAWGTIPDRASRWMPQVTSGLPAALPPMTCPLQPARFRTYSRERRMRSPRNSRTAESCWRRLTWVGPT